MQFEMRERSVEILPYILNASVLQKEILWLNQIIDTRIKLYFQQECNFKSIDEIPPPVLKGSSVYENTIRKFNFSFEERVIILTALSPHICPQLLDIFFIKNETYNRSFTEFGGIKGNKHIGFLPTGETVAFILCGNNLVERFKVNQIFSSNHFFSKQKMIHLDAENANNEPLLSGLLSISKEYLTYFTSGNAFEPKFNNEFPAQKISTNLDWEDLVLDDIIIEEIHEIQKWIKYQKTLMEDWGLKKLVKPGFRSLFYGPPGTGKSLTASLLGKSAMMDVYRIDLSKVVSKYIGETEKNLSNIFDLAENKDWILFFDEADALFGKRTNASDSKDRYANQEVAYLLQRIEDFPGIVILATNLKSNLDEAFARRFQSMIYFSMPRPEHRLKLWEKAFDHCKLSEDVDLWRISTDHELAGGSIINVLRYCSLIAIERVVPEIKQIDIINGIKKELRKEGKTM